MSDQELNNALYGLKMFSSIRHVGSEECLDLVHRCFFISFHTAPQVFDNVIAENIIRNN